MIYLLVVIFTNLFLGIGLAVLLQSRLIAEQPLRLNRLPQRVAEEPKQEKDICLVFYQRSKKITPLS